IWKIKNTDQEQNKRTHEQSNQVVSPPDATTSTATLVSEFIHKRFQPSCKAKPNARVIALHSVVGIKSTTTAPSKLQIFIARIHLRYQKCLPDQHIPIYKRCISVDDYATTSSRDFSSRGD
ncbi:hypothetical protein PanWU01x14_359850, partial [Parasponia andersonii]